MKDGDRPSTGYDDMTTKTWFLTAVAALLGGIYLYYFTDFINTPGIQIIKSDRVIPSARFRGNVYPITFTLDGSYRLTSVKVISLPEAETNKQAKPLWHLVAKSSAPAVKGFLYGQPIRGMEPAVSNARPALLEASVPYRLIVEAGRARGETNFLASPIRGR
jgi:hypothetical protein